MTKTYGVLLPLNGIKDNLSSILVLNRVFRGAGPQPTLQYSLWMNFVRTVDKIVKGYNNARKEIKIAHDKTNHFLHLIPAIGYIEHCISDLNLAIRFLLEINRDSSIACPKIDRTTRRYIESYYRRINKFRDKIQHLETAWIKHKLNASDAVCLEIKKDHIRLAGETVSFNELVSLVSKLYEIAKNQALWQ